MGANTEMESRPRAGRRERIGLAVLALPTLLVSIDVFVMLLALPHLSADLRAGSTEQLWIMDIYGFMICRLPDHHGHAGRPDRSAQAAAAAGRVRLRRRLGTRRVRPHSRAVDRGSRPARDRRGDPGALDPRVDQQHVP